MPLEFRRARRGDLALMGEWFARPHVKPWWREEHDPEAIEERYGQAIDGHDPTELFVVEDDGEPVGFVQRYLIDDNPGWKQSLAPARVPEGAVGIDYLLGTEQLTGHGLGPVMIAQFVGSTWLRYPGAPAVVASVSQGNRRSWRALEKAGFARTWEGEIVSDDPSDVGPSYVYVRHRPQAPSQGAP